MQYYECHITLECSNLPTEYLAVDVENLKWTYSQIDGDPDFGLGVKCYATKQYHCGMGSEVIKNIVQDVAQDLRDLGWNVVREKVELVIYDSRQERLPKPF